jgi:histidine triad (HIT) family protein
LNRQEDCIFCKIAAGEFDSDIVYEDDELLAFRDINPQAPTHILVIPREHISSLKNTTDEHQALLGRLQLVLRDLAEKEELGEGYRVVVNTGPAGGQTVGHLHYHLLGGRTMNWPPG